MERGKSLTVHQVQEVEKLVQDALAKLDQVRFALRTLEERLKDTHEPPSADDEPR